MHALASYPILSVSAEASHCLAVSERGEVFSWGSDAFGQCGHGSASEDELLPRRVGALTGARARSASAGCLHSLVVTEDGAMYFFGRGYEGQLGHGSFTSAHSPKMVDALRHVRIAATFAGH